MPAAAIDADAQILPLNGSRRTVLRRFPLVPEAKGGGRPVVLIPNPYYSVYPSGTIAAGAEAYYVPARAATGFLPDFASVPKSVLRRTVGAFFCSPSNPEGACADEHAWRGLFELADEYDFTVLADECYCEIYDQEPPLGSVEMRYRMSGNFSRLLSFHSLSKRSSAPGLRSGFVFGPPDVIRTMTLFRNTSAPQVPIPVLTASAAAWSDETHVEAMPCAVPRAFCHRRAAFGQRARLSPPKGGFYIWLDVGDGAAFAKELWRKTGVRDARRLHGQGNGAGDPQAIRAFFRPDRTCSRFINHCGRTSKGWRILSEGLVPMSMHRTVGVYQPRSRRTQFADTVGSIREILFGFVSETLRRTLGLVLMVAALAVVGALVSYDSSDPSLDVATWRSSGNWLGAVGGYGADLLFQSVGVGAFAVPLALASWGWQMFSGVGMTRAGVRVAGLLFGIVLFTAGFAALPELPLFLARGRHCRSVAGCAGAAAARFLHLSWLVIVLPLAFSAAGAALIVLPPDSNGVRWRGISRTGTGIRGARVA